MAEVDISQIISQITPLITTVMQLFVMFYMLKFVFNLLQRAVPA